MKNGQLKQMVLSLLFLCLSGVAYAAPVFDNAVAGHCTSGSGTCTLSHTLANASGNDRLVYVGCTTEGDSNITAITYDGVTGTEVAEVDEGFGTASAWYFIDSELPATTGDYDVICTASGTVEKNMTIMEITAASQGVGAYILGSGSCTTCGADGNEHTDGITTTVDDSIILSIIHTGGTTTGGFVAEGTNQTERAEDTGNGSSATSCSTSPKATAGAYTIQWQHNSGNQNRLMSINMAVPPDTILAATFEPLVDTHIKAASATTNYGTNTSLELKSITGGGSDERILMTFNLGGTFDGTETIIASNLFVTASGSLTFAKTDRCHKGLRDFGETTATWNKYDSGGANWTSSGADSDGNDMTGTVMTTTGAIVSRSWGTRSAGDRLEWTEVGTELQDLVDEQKAGEMYLYCNQDTADNADHNFYSSEHTTASDRPVLTVLYSLAAAGTDSTVTQMHNIDLFDVDINN